MKKLVCFRQNAYVRPSLKAPFSHRTHTIQKHFHLMKHPQIPRLLAAVLLMVGLNLCFQHRLNAQVLDAQNKIAVILGDGTNLILYGEAMSLSTAFSAKYYYLPANLRLSAREDGTPEFLFLKYTTEERADQGGVQGALMHFLMEWGLTPAQETEAQLKLKQKIDELKKSDRRYASVVNPVVAGPANLRSDTEESFRIISATMTSKDFTPNLVTTGRAPTLPGSKLAVASILNKNGAQLLGATFEKNRSITDVSINLRFRYDVLMPAVKGEIYVNWEQIYTYFQNIKRDYTHTDTDDGTLPYKNSLRDDVIKDTQKDSLFEDLKERKFVQIKLDVTADPNDPIVKQVVESFMEMFMNSISEKTFQKPEAAKPLDGTPKDINEDLYEYHLDMTKMEQRSMKKTETYRLNVRMPVTQEMTITENLASWYDGVKHNPKCVSSVNLNDPFFQHRDINLILDIEAEQIFGQEANYVTVNVRKKRTSGNPFESAVTIDREYLKNKGLKATMTYARGEDKNPDTYEYKAQWSLKGGNLYPPEPVWIKGDWQGVTLAPPISPRTIMFEADLAELQELGVVNATLQLRYMKFGKEIETSIPLTVSKGIPLVEKMIFTDRNTQGYAYRLVLTHKEKGKMALDWDAKINDDYVYATIPQELKDGNPEFLNKVISAAKTIFTPGADGTVTGANTVLDKFKDVLNIVTGN